MQSYSRYLFNVIEREYVRAIKKIYVFTYYKFCGRRGREEVGKIGIFVIFVILSNRYGIIHTYTYH